jgi:hypothetical protein
MILDSKSNHLIKAFAITQARRLTNRLAFMHNKHWKGFAELSPLITLNCPVQFRVMKGLGDYAHSSEHLARENGTENLLKIRNWF